MSLFGLGTPELMVIIIAGMLVFFFGKKTILGWIRSGKEISEEIKKPSKKEIQKELPNVKSD